MTNHRKNIEELENEYHSFREIIHAMHNYMEENFLTYDYLVVNNKFGRGGSIVVAFNDGTADSLEMLELKFRRAE